MQEEKGNSGSYETESPSSVAGMRFEDVALREAYEKIEKGQFEEAANVFQDIIKRFGVALDLRQKSLIHSELGTLLFWLGDFEAGQRHCEDALSGGITNDQAYNILGKIAVARFQFPQARGYFSKISAENSARPMGLCLVCIKLRDTIGAETFLREASAKVPSSDIEFRAYRAYFQLLKGDPGAATAEARGLVTKCKRDPFLLLLLAEILMTAGNYGEATAVSRKVLANCPQNDHAFAVLAHAAYAEENFNAARNNAEEAVRLNPTNAYAKTILMKLATREGNYAMAESIGLQILSDSPEYSLAHANLGDVYFNQSRYEMAEIEYAQTQQLMNSDTKGSRLRQARMKFIKGDCAGAAEILEKLVSGYHTYYDDAMCDLALCYDKLGDEENKKTLLDKMELRKSFYHRTEQLLRSFRE